MIDFSAIILESSFSKDKDCTMSMFEVVERFSFDGKDYEIRTMSDGADIVIKVFCENKPANGFSYRFNIIEQADFKVLMQLDIMKTFIRIAREHVEQRHWEKYLSDLEKVRR